MNKHLIVMLSCIAIISTVLCSAAFATNTATIGIDSMQEGFDTLSYSGETYHALTTNAGISESNQIKNLIVGYLATEKAYIRNPKAYLQSIGFVDTKALDSATVTYRKSESEYIKELNNLMGWTISEDSLSFSAFKVMINQNTATARIVEDYKYFINDGFNGESFRRREYTFKLNKDSGSWKIVEITTNDPWEIDENFSYAEIDVANTIALLKNEMLKNNNATTNSTITNDMDDKEEKSTTALNKWIYSSANAATYAANHYSDTSNAVFGFTPGNNCQNFASQCVWAGLGGSGTSTSTRPAVSTSVAGSNGPNVWQRNVATTCYNISTLNWTWDNTRGFANMMKVSTATLEGPYGNTQYSGYFGYTNKGDVLEVDWNGSPARDTLDHAMFVTQVSGTSGSRTTSQVKIAAHTSATNSAYQTLSTYTSMPSSAFARVIINSGYYATIQP